MDSVVKLEGGKLVTDSMTIAKSFGKRHDTVLRSIRNLGTPEDFSARNFAAAVYVDAQGKPRQMFTVTRDGFAMLCMGFTGAKAMAWNETRARIH